MPPASQPSRRGFLQSAAAVIAAGAPGAAAEEKPPPVLDPHVHVWKNDPTYPWPNEVKDPPKEDALPETLLRLMQANGVEKYCGYGRALALYRDEIGFFTAEDRRWILGGTALKLWPFVGASRGKQP